MEKFSKELQQKIEEWMKHDKFDVSRKEIQKLVDEGDETTLKDRMMRRIQFGTAGLRSTMAAGFSCMNDLIIVQTTQGLVKYVEEKIEGCKERGVVIGYDHRDCNGYSGKRFGELTAAVFLSQGWKVYLFEGFVPTPFVPYGIHHLGTSCGIMITASHNPKADNGYKLYWENGCQIVSPHDLGISESILKHLDIWDCVMESLKTVHEKVINPLDDVQKGYFEKIMKYKFRSDEENEETSTKIVYTAMHGTGRKWVEKAMKLFHLPPVINTIEQGEPDPTFPTVDFPNPEEGKGSLALALQNAEKNGATIVIANDPDADRLAVAERQKDGQWEVFNGNQIALLLSSWVFDNTKKGGADVSKIVMVNSTVSSKILKGMAEVEGFIFDETLTGFKWIGNKGVEYSQKGYQFLFGYEVEIGFVIGDMSYDKDGIRVSSVFCEMADSVYKRGKLLSEHLNDLYKKYGFYNMKTKYFFGDTQKKLNIVYEKLRTPKYPTHCGKHKIKYVRDLTKGYDNAQKDNKPILPVYPDQQMITFTFEDDSVCTIRNSGTEPKLKWYTECKGKTEQEAQEKAYDLAKSLIDEFIKPEEHGLRYPANWKLE